MDRDKMIEMLKNAWVNFEEKDYSDFTVVIVEDTVFEFDYQGHLMFAYTRKELAERI